MAAIQNFPWAETELPKLIPQLGNIGVQLGTLGQGLGVPAAQIARWQGGAAVLEYLQSCILATRSFSTSFTNARDSFLIDKTPVRFALPSLNLPPQSPAVQAALADPNFLTDYLDFCDDVVEKSIKKSPNYTPQLGLQLGLLTPPAPIPAEQRKPIINSFHDGPLGTGEFNVERGNQPLVKVTVTLDDGRIIENRLPSAKIPIEFPTDRPHAFSAVAVYCDKLGREYGLKSEPFRGTSQI